MCPQAEGRSLRTIRGVCGWKPLLDTFIFAFFDLVVDTPMNMDPTIHLPASVKFLKG